MTRLSFSPITRHDTFCRGSYSLSSLRIRLPSPIVRCALVLALAAGVAGCAQQRRDAPVPAERASVPENQNINDLIRIVSPQPEDAVVSPLRIRGEARGTWFFEATFPVVLTNWDGLIIAETYATAEGDWMTEDFIPFSALLAFEKPDYGERGFLILQKANPSGLPEHDAATEVPIRFK